jgi:hypothetical protein
MGEVTWMVKVPEGALQNWVVTFRRDDFAKV